MRFVESVSFLPRGVAIGESHFQKPDEDVLFVENGELFGENLFDDRGHVDHVVLGRAKPVGRDAIVGRVPIPVSAGLKAWNKKASMHTGLC